MIIEKINRTAITIPKMLIVLLRFFFAAFCRFFSCTAFSCFVVFFAIFFTCYLEAFIPISASSDYPLLTSAFSFVLLACDSDFGFSTD